MKTTEFKLDTNNYRLHNDKNKRFINKSLAECGAGRSILVDSDDCLIAGNGVYEQAQKLGIPIRVIETDGTELVVVKRTDLSADDDKRKLLALVDNHTSDTSDFDYGLIADDFSAGVIADWEIDISFDSEGLNCEFNNGDNVSENGSLAERFGIPPFSILDTRKGYWQKRKKAWREEIGDTLGESRKDMLIDSIELKYPDLYKRSQKERTLLGISFREYFEKHVSQEEKDSASKITSSGVSLFDPVISEICSRWFTPGKGAKIFDCFAGDTQKGLVFGILGYEFIGIELRQEQVDINNNVISGRNLPIKYYCDDGQNIDNYIDQNSQDMLFSCPPYYNLEIYSDLENDASNQPTYDEFLKIIVNAYKKALMCLKDNRFAVIVVGDVRDKKTGFYHNFVDDIKRIFSDNDYRLYNELIIVEQAVSTALRAGKYMESRKVAKIHQNVLVFYKGDTKSISKKFPKIDFSEEDVALFDENMKIE